MMKNINEKEGAARQKHGTGCTLSLDREKSINLFTVNENDEMIRFINSGIDGLITDSPQRLVPIVKE